MTQKKILAVASIGGHWVQLLRITHPLEERYEVVYMSTHPKCKSMVGNCRFHTMMDFSRWNAWKMLPASFNILGSCSKNDRLPSSQQVRLRDCLPLF